MPDTDNPNILLKTGTPIPTDPRTRLFARDLYDAIADTVARKRLSMTPDAADGGVILQPPADTGNPPGRHNPDHDPAAAAARSPRVRITLEKTGEDANRALAATAYRIGSGGSSVPFARLDQPGVERDPTDPMDADQFTHTVLERGLRINDHVGPPAGTYGPTADRIGRWYRTMSDRLSDIAQMNRLERTATRPGESWAVPAGARFGRGLVTDDQLDAVCPEGIIRDRYLVLSNGTFDVDEVSLNWNDAEYWRLRAPGALANTEGDGLHPYEGAVADDPDVIAEERRHAVCSRILSRIDELPRDRDSIHALETTVEDIHALDVGRENPIDVYRAMLSRTARRELEDMGMSPEQVDRAARSGGWNTASDALVRFTPDGDLEGLDRNTAEDLLWDNRGEIIAAAFAKPLPETTVTLIDAMDDGPASPAPAEPDAMPDPDPAAPAGGTMTDAPTPALA